MHAEVRDERFADAVGADVRVEQVATGFGFTEGPVWDKARRQLIWSDMKHDHMRSWSAERGVETYRRPSNKANGNTYDPQGRLVSCEHATSRVVREERDGTQTVLASHWEGRELNSPNDIALDAEGNVYFTDPRYVGDDPRELDFEGVVFVSAKGEVKMRLTVGPSAARPSRPSRRRPPGGRRSSAWR